MIHSVGHAGIGVKAHKSAGNAIIDTTSGNTGIHA